MVNDGFLMVNDVLHWLMMVFNGYQSDPFSQNPFSMMVFNA